MRLFCLQLVASCLQLSFFAYCCVWELFCLQFEIFAYSSSFVAYSWASLLTICLRSTSTDCKQRSSHVSKKAPTVSQKSFPHIDFWSLNEYCTDRCGGFVSQPAADPPETSENASKMAVRIMVAPRREGSAPTCNAGTWTKQLLHLDNLVSVLTSLSQNGSVHFHTKDFKLWKLHRKVRCWPSEKLENFPTTLKSFNCIRVTVSKEEVQ